MGGYARGRLYVRVRAYLRRSESNSGTQCRWSHAYTCDTHAHLSFQSDPAFKEEVFVAAKEDPVTEPDPTPATETAPTPAPAPVPAAPADTDTNTDLDAATEEESGRARAADVEILVGAIQNIHAMTRVGVGDPFHCPHTRTHIYAHTYAHTRVCAHWLSGRVGRRRPGASRTRSIARGNSNPNPTRTPSQSPTSTATPNTTATATATATATLTTTPT